MLDFLDMLGPFGVFAIFIILFVLIIYMFKEGIDELSRKIISGEKKMEEIKFEQKKAKLIDLERYRSVFLNISWAFSLLVVLTIFEYPSFEDKDLMNLGSLGAELEEVIEIPPTEQKTPPPPVIKQPEIVEVPDEEEIEEEIELDLDVEIDESTVIEEVMQVENEEEETADQIFEIVEESATPKGGFATFYKYVGKNIEYPKQARRMGVEGRVYVQFVIEKDGSITDVKVVRGVGAGCDEEAVRVLRKAPKWTPGKQRGRAVRQRMIIPISFKLG